MRCHCSLVEWREGGAWGVGFAVQGYTGLYPPKSQPPLKVNLDLQSQFPPAESQPRQHAATRLAASSSLLLSRLELSDTQVYEP